LTIFVPFKKHHANTTQRRKTELQLQQLRVDNIPQQNARVRDLVPLKEAREN
jgi:hypothetical protein